MSIRIAAGVIAGIVLAFPLACAPGDDAGPGSRADAGRAGAAGYGERVGAVDLPADCADEAVPHLERGLALLHSMTYEGAREAFAAAADADPGCALAPWGEAMSWIHPLWNDPPSEEAFAAGAAVVERARAAGAASGRAGAWVDAVAAYYEAGRRESERPNLEAFAAGWKAAHERFPDDPEAALFRSLSGLALADPSDKSYGVQLASGAVAESVLAAHPDHPGAHHYVIHAYDYPPLAERAEAAARGYADLAPEVPHALHMPSHIFTRLGQWEESIEWNARSAEAAAAHRVDGAVAMHQLHALDYLAYGHLQRAEDAKAAEVALTVAKLEGPFQVTLAGAYALAAVPARLALEREDWETAAGLDPRAADFPWERFPAMEAIGWFAKGIGAARSGDAAGGNAAAARLAELRDAIPSGSAYWATQVEIQRLAVLAWTRLAEGDRDAALATMRESADLEATTEKHPVTPGEILPARELLGDMLREMGRYEEAIAAYEAALERSPNRFRGLYGAGRAAELGGDREAAAAWYGKLLEVVAPGADDRPEIAHAREVVGARA